MLNACTISWLSRKQQSVASFTTAPAYMAIATTLRQAVWYLNAFTQLSDIILIMRMADSICSINIAEYPINNSRTKHLNVAYHFTTQYLIRNSFTLSHVQSNDNTADLIPKALTSVANHVHTSRLGLSE